MPTCRETGIFMEQSGRFLLFGDGCGEGKMRLSWADSDSLALNVFDSIVLSLPILGDLCLCCLWETWEKNVR